MNYRKVNNLTGWITGAIAYVVYLLTMEATASFWDCGEFLSCGYKVEVGHSPGAPFFMLIQRMFGLLAGGNLQNVARLINSESALMGGLTILFLFWTITHMAKKLFTKNGEEPTKTQTLLIMGAGAVGALAYTFSDTFWFSTVEAEVYATSAFFTAITFWAILKWENAADTKYADRWLILIAYLVGISVCVHLLNLLTIPSLAMVYYFRRYKATYIGTAIAFLAGCVLLALVQFGIIQYIPKLASWFDIMFTNNLGLPFDVGSISFIIVLCGVLVWLLFFAKRRGLYLLHTGVLCILFIIIGYSSYIVPVIRSRADVPIDMTNPDNANSLLSYVDREQFGDQPLLFGPDFTSQPSGIKDNGPLYAQTKKNGKDYYEVVGKKVDYDYDPSQLRFFPRIYEHNDPGHVEFYRNYLGLAQGESPTSADNMKFFWGYQINWMWWRYFMWNYAGRQNDVEGQGDPQNGNWLSGIKAIDKMRGLGDIDLMSKDYRDSPARNQLYFLPFILGILGLVFQFNRNRKDGLVIMMLFFFTGAATAIYLNMPPSQPRERDYAFQGCTYAFAVWIGLGVLMVHQLLRNIAKGNMAAYAAVAVSLLAVPVLMANVEWHDHDRHNKTLARAVALNTLQSCAPNAVLFTYGDNQTYPLWYLQEVEGIRNDVRIINTSLLGIDWYIDQLNYKVNNADAIPMVWKKEDYLGDRRNYVQFVNNPQLHIPQDKYISLTDICKFISSNDPANELQSQSGDMENYFPSKNFFAPSMSKADLVKAGLIKASDTSRIDVEMKFTFPKDAAMKSDIAVLNIVAGVANAGWKRPLYFDAGLRNAEYQGMGDYMRLEGLVYRLMPYKVVDSNKINMMQELGTVDVDKSYDLFMNHYIWGGADRTDVYFDEPNRHEFMVYRMNAASVANQLFAEGRKQDAVNVLDKVVKGITETSYSYNDISGYFMAGAYYNIGANDRGRNLTMKMLKGTEDNVNWVNTLNDDGKAAMAGDIKQHLQIMQSLGAMAARANDSTTAKFIMHSIQTMLPRVSSFINTGGQQQQQ
jgi:hypothetical protein